MKHNYYTKIKRFLDIVFSLLGLIILMPFILFILFILFIINDGQALFTQERPGFKGEIFKLYKFKTMNDRRDDNGNLLPDMERMTSFGSFLRNSSLDELPQLVNILNGDMSIVGPRPLLVSYLPKYTPEQMRRHDIKPGLTGWAQVNGRNSLSWAEKFKLDVWYVDNASLGIDFKIILLTVRKVLVRESIDAGKNVTMNRF